MLQSQLYKKYIPRDRSKRLQQEQPLGMPNTTDSLQLLELSQFSSDVEEFAEQPRHRKKQKEKFKKTHSQKVRFWNQGPYLKCYERRIEMIREKIAKNKKISPYMLNKYKDIIC